MVHFNMEQSYSHKENIFLKIKFQKIEIHFVFTFCIAQRRLKLFTAVNTFTTVINSVLI